MPARRAWLLLPFVSLAFLTDPPPPPEPDLLVAAVQVTPKNTVTQSTAHATGYVVAYVVKNTGTVQSTYTLTCSTLGQVSCISVSLAQVTLPVNQQVDVDVTYGTGNASSFTTSESLVLPELSQWVESTSHSSSARL